MSTLPDEILLIIFSNLLPYGHEHSNLADPDDHGNTNDLALLCQVSHRFKRIAEPLLYHTIKFEQFVVDEIQFGLLEEDELLKAGRHAPLSGLDVLCRRPDLGHHVREIGGAISSNFFETRKVQYPDIAQSFVKNTYPPSVSAFIEALLKSEEDNTLDTFKDQYRNREFALVLLLCLSPNVETLSTTIGAIDHSPLVQLFRFVTREINAIPEACPEIAESIRQKWPAVLWNLQKFEGYHDQEIEDGELFEKESIAVARGLPQLKSFEIYRFGDHEYESSERSVDSTEALGSDSRPNMTQLELVGLRIRALDNIRDIFSAFPNLNTVILDFATGPDQIELLEDDIMDSLNDLGDVLRSISCGRNLRRFELDVDFEGFEIQVAPGAIGSIRSHLENLTQLRVSVGRLADLSIMDGSLTHVDLCSLLPESLQCFWTSISGHPSFHEIRAVERMLLTASQWLPKLEWIRVDVPVAGYNWSFEPPGWQRTTHRAWYTFQGEPKLAERCIMFRKETAVVYADGRTPPGWERFIQ